MLPKLSKREETALKDFLLFTKIKKIPRMDERNLYTDTDSFTITPAFLKATFSGLCEKGVLAYSHDNDTSYYEISSYYADDLWEMSQKLSADGIQIPASDRFVQLDHNSKEFKETISKLEEIEERVQKSNDLVADKSERLAIIREVKTLRENLNEKVVRTGSILASTRDSGILLWLSQHCSDAVLNVLAAEAISHILKLFGMS
jgi:hypothetical protein